MSYSEDVLARFAEYLGAVTDGPISEALGVSRSSISSWRARDSVPYRHFVEFAMRDEINLNWLLLGDGPQRRGATKAPSPEAGGLRAALAAEGRAAEEELGLGEVASLARLGTLGGAWRVMEVVYQRHPAACGLVDLGAALAGDVTERDLGGYVAFLLRMGLIREAAPGLFAAAVQVGMSEVQSQSTFDRHQHAMEAMRVLMQAVLPAMEHKRAKLLTIRGRLDSGVAAALVEDLARTVKDATRTALEAPGEAAAIDVVLAIAYEPAEVLQSKDPNNREP